MNEYSGENSTYRNKSKLQRSALIKASFKAVTDKSFKQTTLELDFEGEKISDLRISKTIFIESLAIIVLVSSLVSAFVSSNFAVGPKGDKGDQGLQGAQGPQGSSGTLNATSSASYVISWDGNTIKAYNGSTGKADYEGSNSSEIIELAVASAPKGGLVFLKAGAYGPFTVNKSVSIVGEGIFADPRNLPSDPDDILSNAGGTVIQVTTSDTNGITLVGTLTVSIKNLVIRFSGNGTGSGIYSDPGFGNSGLLYSTLENIIVLGHDADHYAFNLVNFLHITGKMLFSFGGPAIYFASLSNTIKYGDAVFEEVLARTAPSLQISRNIVELVGTNWQFQLNLIEFRRLDIMDRSSDLSTSYSLHMDNSAWITIHAADFEFPNDGRMIQLENCNYVNIYTQLIYGGSIIHNNTLSCGYYGSGWLDHGSFPMTSNGQGDFIHNLNVVGNGEFAGFRVDH
jgi:hypothetical protein